jgi:hypothetical protein
MTAYVQKGKAVFISKAPTPTAVSITGATAANPCVITVVNTAADGDIVRIEGTGMAALDGRAFEVDSATGTSITVQVDATGDVAATSGSAFFYDMADVAEMVETCFNSFGYNREAAATITAGTFCGTTTLSGAPGAQTIEFAGYDDPESEGMKEIIRAEKDGIPRVVVYNYPPAASATGVGYKLILPAVTFAGFNGPVATADGAATFSGSGTVNGDPTYTFMN